MTINLLSFVFLASIAFSSVSEAQTYRYSVKPKGSVKGSCKDSGQTQKSRVKIELQRGQSSQKLASVRLRARVCTLAGFVRFSPRIMLPMRFIDGFRVGDNFEPFRLSFNPSSMTDLDGKSANNVVVSNAGRNPRDVTRAGISSKSIQWMRFEWKNGSKKVFGPVYLGFSAPGSVRARGFSRRTDIPASHIVIVKGSHRVAGTLNEID